MNLEHLGDALDFWKGGLIGVLRNSLHNIRVVPMFTDPMSTDTNWTPAHLDLYAQLLGVNGEDILQSGIRFSKKNRGTYFNDLSIGDNTDLFVDPDIGIEPKKAETGHIKLKEINQLLRDNRSRVVLVYQHSSRKKGWVTNRLEKIDQSRKQSHTLRRCRMFAYWAGSVSMVFISRDHQRLKQMSMVLDGMTYSLHGKPGDLTRVIHFP